ncbi:MAG: serine protein kinase PrkA [Desulfobacteraceae bacterium]|nr:MAG: serine protein kinase PrkA [Desulfobacteraceae bacterium]
MDNINFALRHLRNNMSEMDQRTVVSFEDYLKELVRRPETVMRNVFQVLHHMVTDLIGAGKDEYPGDPESIDFVYYDCHRLFVEDSDHPYFADRLFANRLVRLVEALKRGAQQNKIYIFKGPPGCGKSTFLNNLLMKFEKYAATENGLRYEAVWRFERNLFGASLDRESSPALLTVCQMLEQEHREDVLRMFEASTQGELEIPCPSHDDPIVMIPKAYRRAFLEDLFRDHPFGEKLFREKEFDWVFKDTPCTICSSLYQALLDKLEDPQSVFKMLYARPYRFNRRLGEGISVFNPGDRPLKENILRNPMLQKQINNTLNDGGQVKYIFSQYAKTNNGIYALMDIKTHNIDRLIELHNIISEGVHKVEDIEENVNSLLLAVMNPEDEMNLNGYQSFLDRVEYIKIPYVMDLSTEVEIYRNIFGRHIDKSFLPRVLENFARVIISTRLNTRSEALLEWIGNPLNYSLYCDENLHLLKMEIYSGHIPTWLTDQDRKRLTSKRRKRIIAESESDGDQGISGRDSIKIFNEFYSTYAAEDKLINMSMLYNFFSKVGPELNSVIPRGFLDSLLRMYNYWVLQEVKEALYYYNPDQITRDIQNYLFAINFEIGSVVTCRFTGDRLEITPDFFEMIEKHLLGAEASNPRRLAFREETQKEYTATTLPQEIMLQDKPLVETEIFSSLHERYTYNLKENVLDPFLQNENFRRALRDFDRTAFKTYDKRIQADVTYLLDNLCSKFRYTKQGAKEVCMYVIDNNLAEKFAH